MYIVDRYIAIDHGVPHASFLRFTVGGEGYIVASTSMLYKNSPYPDTPCVPLVDGGVVDMNVYIIPAKMVLPIPKKPCVTFQWMEATHIPDVDFHIPIFEYADHAMRYAQLLVRNGVRLTLLDHEINRRSVLHANYYTINKGAKNAYPPGVFESTELYLIEEGGVVGRSIASF